MLDNIDMVITNHHPYFEKVYRLLEKFYFKQINNKIIMCVKNTHKKKEY